MAEWATIIIGFIGGGAFNAVINWRINRKKESIDLDDKKLDFAKKSVEFMDSEQDRYRERIEKLEHDVELLMQFKCERIKCKLRIPPREDLSDEKV